MDIGTCILIVIAAMMLLMTLSTQINDYLCTRDDRTRVAHRIRVLREDPAINGEVPVGPSVRKVVNKATSEAFGEAPVDLKPLLARNAAIEITQNDDHYRWLSFSGEPHHDPLLAPAWTLTERVGKDGPVRERKLGDAQERDRWQAAALRTLLRSGCPDVSAAHSGAKPT